MKAKIEYSINPELDEIIDEKGNSYIAFRKITWGDEINPEKEKLDIRKYYTNADGEETLGKGISFLTEEGPHQLTKTLIEKGFGHSDDIAQAINSRDDKGDIINYLNNKTPNKDMLNPLDFIGEDND